MSNRLPWGHQSRYCARCGKVGPRCTTKNEIGYVHLYCLTSEEKKERKLKQTYAITKADTEGN